MAAGHRTRGVHTQRGAESQAHAAAGKTIAEIARLWNKDPIDTAMDILIEDEAFTMVGMFIMNESDVALAVQQSWVSICNDSQGTALDGVLGREHPHPRAY